jgi:hypothetical protein
VVSLTVKKEVRLVVRLPRRSYTAIKRVAQLNRRSLVCELIAAVEKRVKDPASRELAGA